MQNSNFRWICLGLACISMSVALWMLNDVRVKFTKASEKLPEVIENSRNATATLKELSEDIKDIRELAGAATGDRKGSYVRYANDILKLIETEGKGSVIYSAQSAGAKGKVLDIAKKIVGGGNGHLTVEEWVRSVRGEAILLVFVAKSKEELLQRICKTTLGEPFMIEKDGQAQSLESWVKERQKPESGE